MLKILKLKDIIAFVCGMITIAVCVLGYKSYVDLKTHTYIGITIYGSTAFLDIENSGKINVSYYSRADVYDCVYREMKQRATTQVILDKKENRKLHMAIKQLKKSQQNKKSPAWRFCDGGFYTAKIGNKTYTHVPSEPDMENERLNDVVKLSEDILNIDENELYIY